MEKKPTKKKNLKNFSSFNEREALKELDVNDFIM